MITISKNATPKNLDEDELQELVCSMITVSKNATPKNLHEDESLVQLQEARVPGISFHKLSTAQT